MLAPAEMRFSRHQRWTAAAAVAAVAGAWDLALFLFIGGVAPSRALLARAAFLDAALALPVAALALSLTQPLSHRVASAAPRGGRLASAALPALAFGLLLVPAAALREASVALTAGASAGLAGATDALSRLDAGRWLCTVAVGPATASSTAARDTLAAGARAALLLQIPALPAFFVALALARRRAAAACHAIVIVAAVGASGALVLAVDTRPGRGAGEVSLGPACRPGLDVRIHSVSAIEVDVTPSPYDGRRSRARVFALDRDLPAIQAGKWPAPTDRTTPTPAGDPLSPLVIRARLGECLHVVFTNRLTDLPAAFRVHGLPHLTTRSGGIGALPPDYEPRPGETVAYSFQIPSGPEWARHYLVQEGGDGGARPRRTLAAIAVEQRESVGERPAAIQAVRSPSPP